MITVSVFPGLDFVRVNDYLGSGHVFNLSVPPDASVHQVIAALRARFPLSPGFRIRAFDGHGGVADTWVTFVDGETQSVTRERADPWIPIMNPRSGRFYTVQEIESEVPQFFAKPDQHSEDPRPYATPEEALLGWLKMEREVAEEMNFLRAEEARRATRSTDAVLREIKEMQDALFDREVPRRATLWERDATWWWRCYWISNVVDVMVQIIVFVMPKGFFHDVLLYGPGTALISFMLFCFIVWVHLTRRDRRKVNRS